MKNQKQQEDGLPEVAQRLREKKPVVLIILGLIILVCFKILFLNKSKDEILKPVEETYTVQQSGETDILKTQSVAKQSENISATQNVQANPELIQQQVALIQAKQNELQQRLAAPLMLVNNAKQDITDAPTPIQQGTQSSDRNTQFLNQVASQSKGTALATTIAPLNTVIAEGSLIHAILESATNSDLPGNVRATVSESSYSEDGSQVLIPRGSRLMGQYKSGMLQGQSRIFLVWTRLITPSGVSLQLGSSGTDSLGVAGLGADEIDRHFWERFGTASLLSIIGTGAANAGASAADQENSVSAYRTAMANSFAQSAEQSLQQDSRIPPTLTTYQGKPIMVFVAKDLNFQNAIKQTKPKLNIF
ncbi:MAG: TrbI/VirB10 family protein [Gammaproteobacteria bacterium]|nr:TrbI/VirB10 family protein [Gammaproteobacteria bacterium]